MSDDSFGIICSRCRAEVPADTEICPACGNVLLTRPGQPVTTPIGEATARARKAAAEAAASQEAERVAQATSALLDERQAEFAPSSFAGFWIRLVASLFDSLLIGLAALAVAELAGRDIAAAVPLAAFAVYYPLMEQSSARGTIGKLLCGLDVTDTEGRQITISRAYARVLGRVLCALTLFIGYVVVAFTARKQGLHDLVAGTLVLNSGSY